jgi:heme/copper-type cytochrome/quinol oxidase subunit 3
MIGSIANEIGRLERTMPSARTKGAGVQNGPASGQRASGQRAMIRPVLTELALFGSPFLAYVLFLWATRAGVLEPSSWPLHRLAWLTGAALLLMLGSFVVLAHFSGASPGTTYVPAHIEDGRLVPGRVQ